MGRETEPCAIVRGGSRLAKELEIGDEEKPRSCYSFSICKGLEFYYETFSEKPSNFHQYCNDVYAFEPSHVFE